LQWFFIIHNKKSMESFRLCHEFSAKVTRFMSVHSTSMRSTGSRLRLFIPRVPTRMKPLSPSYFTPLTLASSENSGPNTKLLTFKVPPDTLPSPDSYDLAPIWSVFIKDDDIQVERPYTPLEGVDEQGRMRFWIKKYEKGEVGRWLHSKSIGDTIEIRGPLKTWLWQDNVWDDVVMISGGTGITPFYQLLNNVFGRKSSNTNSITRFTVLHSSRIPSELPPHSMVKTLLSFAEAYPNRFKMSLFVDSLDGPADASLSSQKLIIGRISKSEITRSLGLDTHVSWFWRLFKSSNTLIRIQPNRKVLFLVCGPEQMIAAISGPYVRNFSQGEVGGILGELGYTSSQVRKL